MPGLQRGIRNGTPFVVVPQGSFIPIPFDRLLHTIVNNALKTSSDRKLLIDFARRLEGIYRQRWYNEHSILKRGFALFSPQSNGKNLIHLRDAEIDVEEDLFLDKFHEIMMRGNYEILGQSAYQLALEEDYLFNVRATVQWKNLSSQPFARFLERHHEELVAETKDMPADILKHVLVYHRGVGCDRTTTRMTMETIDMLFYKIAEHGRYLLERLQFWKPRVLDPAEAETPVLDHVQIVERRNVKSQFSILNLFKPIKMQEPTFGQIIIVYRPPVESPRPHGVISHAEANERRVQSRCFHIKSFVDVPMADLEMILPEKEISMNPFDFLKIIFAVLGALFAVYVQVFGENVEGESAENIAFATIAVLASYVMKLVVQISTQNQKYNLMVTQSIYKKSLDNHDGVMLYLIDSVLEQELKEALLAYYFLWQNGSKTYGDLDALCEQFIKTEFAEHVNFEVDDAVEKLLRDNVVTANGDKLKAISIEQAIKELDTKWQQMFTSKNAQCPYCPFMAHTEEK